MAGEDGKYDVLKLENQMCFLLYACSKEVMRKYRPLLDELDLTYTQYLVMLVLWERRNVSVKEVGDCLCLDSGTLTPLLRKLESKGYVVRSRCSDDERKLSVSLTEKGLELRDRAVDIPRKMSGCVQLDEGEGVAMYSNLRKILSQLLQ